MKHKKKLALTAVLVLLAAGIGGYFSIRNAEAAKKEEVPANEREYKVMKGSITVGIDGTGKVEVESRSYSLPKEIAVSNMAVKEGDWVKEGQLLMEMNRQESQKYQDQLKEQLKSLEENIENLTSEREKYLDSMTGQLESSKKKSLKQYQSDLKELNSRIKELEKKLSKAERKRDNVSDDELNRDTVTKLEEELEKKRAEQEERKSQREAEIQQEQDPAYQKTLREEKLGELDGKIESCKKELEDLKLRMEKAKSPQITAEKEGVVIKANNNPGEGSVVEIGQREDMIVRLSVEQEDIVDVQENQEVEFTMDAYPDIIFKGKVAKRILSADSNGKYAALVAIENKEQAEILPGMNASGILVVKQKKDILTLPNKAIELKDGKQYIKVRNEEGVLEDRLIETGFSDGKLTEILSGAKEGDTAVTQVVL